MILVHYLLQNLGMQLATRLLLFIPFLVGLIFLIPLDITFSCWVFFFYWKAQLVIGSALGQVQRPEFPEQSAGAYISLCVIAIWMAKKHIVMILKSLIVGPAGNLDSYQNA